MTQIIHWLNANKETVIALILLGYGANSGVSAKLSRLRATPFWRVVRLMHGILDRVDPTEVKDEPK